VVGDLLNRIGQSNAGALLVSLETADIAFTACAATVFGWLGRRPRDSF
jgi:hypothetical protein